MSPVSSILAILLPILQPSFLVSSFTLSIHLDFGWPHPQLQPGFVHSIFLGNSLPPIRTTWPVHRSPLDFITMTNLYLVDCKACFWWSIENHFFGRPSLILNTVPNETSRDTNSTWIWCLSVRASLHMRREEKPTRCHWILYCTYNMLNMFRALLCPSSGVREYTGLFISSSGISELDCATTKTDTAERSISISREFLQVFLY